MKEKDDQNPGKSQRQNTCTTMSSCELADTHCDGIFDLWFGFEFDGELKLFYKIANKTI